MRTTMQERDENHGWVCAECGAELPMDASDHQDECVCPECDMVYCPAHLHRHDCAD